MARTNLPLKTTGRVGAQAAITFVTADGTNQHSFANTGEKVLLLIKNAHTSPHAVTIKRPATIDGATLADLSITVANGAEAIVGPFPASIYNQTDGTVYVDVPATPTALTLAAIRLGSL